MRFLLFFVAVAGAASPLAASSSTSSPRPPAELKQCLAESLGAAGMVVVVSPLPNDGFAIEAKPFNKGKSSSIVVNVSGDSTTLLANSPKGSPSPSAADLALKKCSVR